MAMVCLAGPLPPEEPSSFRASATEIPGPHPAFVDLASPSTAMAGVWPEVGADDLSHGLVTGAGSTFGACPARQEASVPV